MIGEVAQKAIEQARERLYDLGIKMWENPEVAYLETKACHWTAEYLKEEGFDVEVGCYGVPTAIRAVWGSGHPVIGLLAEFDALPGLSQSHSALHEEVVPGGPGHGCGHNLLDTATLGAAIGLKAEMTERKLPGTIVFYGCPAEEVLTGKVFMAREGAFKECDCALAYHPGMQARVGAGIGNGLNSFYLHFHGISSHAGGAPHEGRSALDAIELTNVGINYLREHVPMDVRIHYSYLNGGTAPNIVPADASAWYMVRAQSRELIESVYERILNIARGAALMTDTQLTIDFKGGCYPGLPNEVLAQVLQSCMEEIPAEEPTEAELNFAKTINDAVGVKYEETCKRLGVPVGTQYFTGVLPISRESTFGSTDVGDVAHIVPTGTFNTTTLPIGCPGHSWMTTAGSGSTYGAKGAIRGAKIMAQACLKLIEDPTLVRKAKEEFDRAMDGKTYKCPIPKEVPVPFTK